MANRVLVNKIQPNKGTTIPDSALQMQLFTSRLKTIIELINNNFTWAIDNWNLFILSQFSDEKDKYFIQGTLDQSKEYYKNDFPDFSGLFPTSGTDIVYSLEEQVAELEARIEALKNLGTSTGPWRRAQVAIKPNYPVAGKGNNNSTSYGSIWDNNRTVTCKLKYQKESRWFVIGGTNYTTVDGLWIKGKSQFAFNIGEFNHRVRIGRFWPTETFVGAGMLLCIK